MIYPHLRSFHLKIKNYFCKFCNMAFSQSGNARRHERRCASMDNINNGGSMKSEGMNCIQIGLPGKLILSKRKGLQGPVA